jgi:hypothetical protein
MAMDYPPLKDTPRRVKKPQAAALVNSCQVHFRMEQPVWEFYAIWIESINELVHNLCRVPPVIWNQIAELHNQSH